MLVVLIENMAEPGADGIDVHAGENQVAGRRMPDHMRGYRSARQGRHPDRVTFDKAINPEAGKGCSEPADEHGVLGCRPMTSSARTRSVSGHSGHWRVLPPFPCSVARS